MHNEIKSAFNDYISKYYLVGGVLKCIKCSGNGRVYDPKDPPCPIEGNKLRDKIKCPKCEGSKIGEPMDYLDSFISYIKTVIQKEESERHSRFILEKLKKTLTAKELNFLSNNLGVLKQK